MARTINEILEDMIGAKEADQTLSALTSTSVVAVWRVILFICAVAIKVVEDLFDVLRDDIEERKLEIPVGNLKWYAAESLVYQFGDSLVFVDEFIDETGATVKTINNILTYAVIDPEKYVVDLAAADLENGVILVKAAKLNNNVAEPLTAEELAGFTQYWIEKRFAGESVTVISQNADLLKTSYRITYDPQTLSSTGESLLLPGVFPVEEAINNFLQDYQGENFNGTMQVMKLTDAIQTVSGVKNAIATQVDAKPEGGTYTDVLAIDNQSYKARAGYMQIDPAFPLNTTLSYVLT
jgi:hypothetical protein